MTSAFVDAPGAVLGVSGVPLHLGNPVAEGRVLDDGAWVLLPREVLRLTGADRLTWLDSITTQAIARLQPGVSTETLVLSPEGRIEHAMRLVDDGDSLWAIVDAGRADALEAWLTRMRFWAQVDIARVDVPVVGWTGSIGPVGVAWDDPWPLVAEGGVRYGSGEDLGPWGWHETAVTGDVGEPPAIAGTLALDARRIAAGRPTIADVDDRTIPHELDWLATAVHLAKGCYRGQETVAKVHNLGSPPRRLALLHLDGSDAVLPFAGDVVTAAGAEVGRITVAAQHHELGPVALAMLKRSVDPDASLVVLAGDEDVPVAAAQQVLVPPTAGHAHRPPRLPRLGAVRRPTA
ncbi:CAF17-like 4Fe-4S cluster assembly/insertion protein YgfZ [Agrococcus sp. SGAir0287]|uniref:CAF17-like 4Fe-4S cluster assembly/insertion protein YgfZ n=1 Tax=Agrococcus sp. SGAir0287 TaxID=2070347 RepID=UPI0010CD3EA2|nr:folate-binding protein YgfZ [Agrococcus sp. SGAir0287]QCR19925.1 folate-binding protein YgfZ [Agrococcus sp. SGAir0287]